MTAPDEESGAPVVATGPHGGSDEVALVTEPIVGDVAAETPTIADVVEESHSGSRFSTAPTDGSPDFRMVLVSSITVDLPNQHPAVCLREMESPRRQLTFSVGMQDGAALSHAMRRIPTPRPLAHELMTGVLQQFDIDLVAVRIVGRVGSVHFAELDLRGTAGRSVHPGSPPTRSGTDPRRCPPPPERRRPVPAGRPVVSVTA